MKYSDHRGQYGYGKVELTERNHFIVSGNNIVGEVNTSTEDYLDHFQVEDKPDFLSPNSKSCRAWIRELFDRDSTEITVNIIIILNGFLHVIQTSRFTDDCCVDNLEAQK